MSEAEAIRLLVETLEDVIGAHADPSDNGYNECDSDECQWCVHAKQLIDYFSSRPALVKACKWHEAWTEETTIYNTSCDNTFVFTDGEFESEFCFCPYCGAPIEVREVGE